MTNDLTLEDLAIESGVSIRTLRYYMQEGILQGPDSQGRNARYSREHLDRLELIRRMKQINLPLQEIKHLLDNMNPEEISKVREYQDELGRDFGQSFVEEIPSLEEPISSAWDYIRGLEQERETLREISNKSGSLHYNQEIPIQSTPHQPHFKNRTKQETWTKIIIEDGVELTIRQPKGTDEQKKIDLVIRYAQDLFGDQNKKGEK